MKRTALLLATTFLPTLAMDKPALPSTPATHLVGDDIESLRQKAAQGDANAQTELAFRHRDGKGVPKDDREAMRWAHLAADQGDARALDFVGWMFFTGKGVRQDHRVAYGYFHAAAEGSAQGAYNLGQSCFAALGTEQDIPRALATWKSAAERGHGRAASTAAMVYLAGDGVPADPAEARRLAEMAAALNDPNGLVVLGEMQFQAGEVEAAKASWARVSKMKPVGATGNPEQASDVMAAQQGADLLKLLDHRRRKPEPGKFALVHTPHLYQGWNNCGATSCAMYARALGKSTGSWEYKSFCPSPFGTGTDWSDLVAASAKIGMKWKLVIFPPDDDGFTQATAFLRTELDAGRPVVIDFKYFGPQYPNGEAGHTLVVSGYLADENLFILCNPAIASPGLALITAADLKRYWRSNYYGAVAKGVMARPAIVLDQP